MSTVSGGASGRPPVHHKQTATGGEFLIDCEGREPAVLRYEVVDGKVLDMYHTGVPRECQGRGIAVLLATVRVAKHCEASTRDNGFHHVAAGDSHEESVPLVADGSRVCP